MAKELITVEHVERMTAAERRAAFDASIVWDLDDAPQELVERARSAAEARIRAEAEADS